MNRSKRRRRQAASQSPALLGTSDKEQFPSQSSRAVIEGLGASEPYDDGLVDRLRAEFLRGNWVELISVDIGIVEAHPQRVRIGLMLLAAYHAIGEPSKTRAVASLCLQWGASRDLVARILVAGVHNTIGRALVIQGGSGDRAFWHFANAVSPVAGVASLNSATQTRITSQALSARSGALKGVGAAITGSDRITSEIRSSEEPTPRVSDPIEARIKDLADQLTKTRRAIEEGFKRELGLAVKQVEAYLSISKYFHEGELIPDFHGWPISPDFGAALIGLLETRDYDLVVEFGSGTSTLLIAKVLESRRKRSMFAPELRCAQIAFEHLETYREKTDLLLMRAGLQGAVKVVLAPLEAWDENGRSFLYYRCGPELKAYFAGCPLDKTPKVLILVDGPPASTGPHARYPALPVVLAHVRAARVDVLLDDFSRQDEKEVFESWKLYLSERGCVTEVTEIPLEKGACMLSFNWSGD